MFRFVDLFSGIGGFRIALEALGGVCVASSEIAPRAIEVYQANWPHDKVDHNLGDITTISHLPAHELMVGGVPCQPWSIAGKNMAFDDPRGELWNDVIRLVQHNQPRAFMFENVKGLVDPRHEGYLAFIKSAFKSAGYNVHIKLLNSFDYGVPQNRDRVFLVGIRQNIEHLPFEFPFHQEAEVRLFEIFNDIESPEVVKHIPIQRDIFGERTAVGFNKLTPQGYYNEFFMLTDLRDGPTCIHSWEIWDTTEREKNICKVIMRKRRSRQYGLVDGNPLKYEHIKEFVPDLHQEELEQLVAKQILQRYDERYEFKHRRLSGGIEGVFRIYLPDARFFGTLTARGMKDMVAEVCVYGDTAEAYKQNFIDQVLRPKRFRIITDREAAMLQGFPNWFKLHPNQKVNLPLFGNSVAVPVVQAVGKALLNTGAIFTASVLERAY